MERFRARAGAAPLKQSIDGTLSNQTQDLIPRPRGRGPIEASTIAHSIGLRSVQFRARAGAAPLKPAITHKIND